MTIVAELIALIQAIAPLEPAAVAAIEAILKDATSVPTFDASSAAARIAAAQTALSSLYATDDAALAAKFPGQ
jgi:hypothetical protein